MLQSSVWWLFQNLPHVRRYHFYYVVCTYSTYGPQLRPMNLIEYARTYVFLHDFTYEIYEKRTGWQPCGINQRRDSL